ncbi:general secretion pathway protein GspH [filamentous cyanobacterium Phorm 46]|nr:general secretion pathway protein GspH [filamentous cyanobacterium Phorm 46]
MRKQNSDSYSILLDVCIALLKVGGGLLLTYIGLIALLLVPAFFFSFGINDKQVEIFVGTSFLDKANNSKQSEAKQYVGSMNRSQQAYFAENNALATSIEALGIGIKTERNNYKYSLRVTQTSAFSYAVAKKPELKNYLGGVFLVPAKELDPNARRDEMTTATILCQTEKLPLIRFKQTDEPAEPIYQNGEVICGKGTTDVNK